jgi:peptide/nickel transport system substrate-binding protein
MKRAPSISSLLVVLLLVVALAPPGSIPQTRAADAPAGQMTWAVHFSLAPTFFDPAETPGLITPFLVLYALHDALVF